MNDSKKQLPSIHQTVLQLAKEQEGKSSMTWNLLFGAAPMLAPLSIPFALVAAIVGMVGDASEKVGNLQDRHMPDSWLQQVAQAEGVSPAGLAYLAKKLAGQGFVSVHNALEWLDIEEEEARKAKVESANQSAGASALIARAQKECSHLLEAGLIEKACDSVKKVALLGQGIAAKFAGIKH